MIYASIALFALAAVLGLLILISWLNKKDASRNVVYAHGIVALIAVVLLVLYAVQNPANFPKTSLILFAVAALAGLYMFMKDLIKQTSSMGLAFTHALVAVAGFVLLLIFTFS